MSVNFSASLEEKSLDGLSNPPNEQETVDSITQLFDEHRCIKELEFNTSIQEKNEKLHKLENEMKSMLTMVENYWPFVTKTRSNSSRKHSGGSTHGSTHDTNTSDQKSSSETACSEDTSSSSTQNQSESARSLFFNENVITRSLYLYWKGLLIFPFSAFFFFLFFFFFVFLFFACWYEYPCTIVEQL